MSTAAKRKKANERLAHDRPYLVVKGLIMIVQLERRSARVGEPMRALNRRYLGTRLYVAYGCKT